LITSSPADGEVPDTSLKEVLSFFTGAESVPPLGFERDVEVWFNHESQFPMASTCALQLTLPTLYHNQADLFQEKMVYALHNHGGFGLF